jgi:uncharacterized protein YjbI with pentapeptide repeats
MSENDIWTPPLLPKDQKRLNRQRERRWQKVAKWTGFFDKALWDWLQLLAALAIPVVIAAGTLWFSAQQNEVSARTAQDQQQETAFQTYIDRMSDLLLRHNLHESKDGDEVRNVARLRTITILPQLNGIRKGEIAQFLYEAALIGSTSLRNDGTEVVKAPVISLSEANFNGVDLRGAKLRGADLNGADLKEANFSGADLYKASISCDLRNANLSGADLRGADLNGADLKEVNLSGADLRDAILFGDRLRDADLRTASLRKAILFKADLREADLREADLREVTLSGANLSGANLSASHLNEIDLRGADLSGANLSGADLSGADLSLANLSGAKVTQEQLKKAESLEGVTMSDGSKHPLSRT